MSTIYTMYILLKQDHQCLELTRNTVLLTNDCGLSTSWKTGASDPMTLHLKVKVMTPVTNKARWRQNRRLPDLD